MAQALAAHFAQRNFHAALVADHSAMLHTLVFSAQTFPVRDGAKNLGAEQSVAFRLESAVIDSLRLGHFTMRPGTDFFRTRQADANGIKIRYLAGAIIRARSVQGRSSCPAERDPNPAKQEPLRRNVALRGISPRSDCL